MARETGTYRITRFQDEEVRAFVPHPLPPENPPLAFEGTLDRLHIEALVALERLGDAGAMVPSTEWFIYGFVRKEAVITSQIEGTQATLLDVLTYEATNESDRIADVEEVCNYVDAYHYAQRELRRPSGLPISTRLLCGAHKRLMKGTRGARKQPGKIRTSQNWIGGTRPGNARFVPPQPEAVMDAMASLEKWVHADDPLPPLVKAGLAHVQFETIHPFLDGNGRIGRLLIVLLLEHWNIPGSQLLYLSLALKRHQQEYYRRLAAVRTDGDWEGWVEFFLECVREAALDGVYAARRISAKIGDDHDRIMAQPNITVTALRLFDLLPTRPMLTLPLVIDVMETTKPTAIRAIESLEDAGILYETTGKKRDRVYAYKGYLDLLTDED